MPNDADSIRYAYLLNFYEEDGPTNAVITLDRSRIPDLIAERYDAVRSKSKCLNEWKEEALRTARSVLERPDEELARNEGYNLAERWGGLQLSVVRIR